ncbi:hypothetical protein [Actinomadura alba]|uniref:hypothetical protein n=1 Tax=Actinomadura alba TaxID=406431 RepID=UPI001C9CC72D|nr:hypothetical protein [Actinomadura alba]
MTSLEFRLHPVHEVYAGTACFAIERAAETMAFYRDWCTRIPDELSTALTLTTMPDAPHVAEAVRERDGRVQVIDDDGDVVHPLNGHVTEHRKQR